MKILHISHGFPPESIGGTELYLRNLVAAQAEAGHQVLVLSGCKELRSEVQLEEIEQEGVRILRLYRDDLYFDHFAKIYHPVVGEKVREVLSAEKPDLVHVHQWIRLTSNLVEIASDLGIKTLVTLHDLYSSCPRCFRVNRDNEHCELRLSVESCLDCVPRFGHESRGEIQQSIQVFAAQFSAELCRAGRVLVSNQATAEIIAANTAVDLQALEILPIPYRPRLREGLPDQALPDEAMPADGETLRFAYWGSVTRRKGCLHLLQAFRALCESWQGRPIELHLFGPPESDEFAAELDRLAAGLPVNRHGPFALEDVAAAKIHMAVFPALGFETYGLVLDEATELRLPTILSDLGAMPDRAGAGALRVGPGDSDALLAAMRRVLEEPGLIAAMRANLPLPSPTREEHARRLEEIYAASRLRPAGANATELAAEREAFHRLRLKSAAGQNCPEGGPG